MVLYTCPRCHYDTTLKTDIRRHYTRKRSCRRLFSRAPLMELLDELDSPNEKQVKISKEEWECLLEENRVLKEKSLNTVTNNTTNNTTNNIYNNKTINNTINIHVNDFKDTNYVIALEDLKESIKNSLLKNDGMNMNIECENLIELVHCNDKYPENHNVLITDKTRGEARIKDGNEFKLVPKDDVIEQAVNSIVNLLKENRLFGRYIRFHERKDEDIVREDKKAAEMSLYNNRRMIMETAKIHGIKI